MLRLERRLLMKKKSDVSVFWLAVGVVIAIVRGAIGDSSGVGSAQTPAGEVGNPTLLYMMVVNLAAFGAVWVCFFNNFENECLKIFSNRFSVSQCKSPKRALSIVKYIAIAAYVVFMILYALFFSSELGNDILSILALTLSLSGDRFIEEFAPYIGGRIYKCYSKNTQ